MQLLLVRHALPNRSEPGEGPDQALSDAGIEQARRLPEARQATVAAINGTEHVWDLLPRNQRW